MKLSQHFMKNLNKNFFNLVNWSFGRMMFYPLEFISPMYTQKYLDALIALFKEKYETYIENMTFLSEDYFNNIKNYLLLCNLIMVSLTK